MNTYELKQREVLTVRDGSQNEATPSQQDRDEAAMAKFGKKQQLRRRFKPWSSIGLTSGLMLTWEAVLFDLTLGLTNGGPAGLIYGFLASWLGAALQSLVMAEMASMIPLAGGPFNWVAILAPPSYRKFLSYFAGWLTVIAWQGFVAEVCYICGLLIQSLLILNQPTYVPHQWHVTLLFYAIMVFGIFTNTLFGRFLPRLETLMLMFYIAGFFGVLIPLVYLAPHKSAKEVFTVFQDGGQWGSTGLSFMAGWIGCVSCFIGNDGADHIAEETQDAQRVLPFSMWFSIVLNGILGFSMTVAILFCMGSLTDPALTETNFPFMAVLIEALGSKGGGLVLCIVITAVNIFSISSVLATSSRMLWAFSRENGLPFSSFIVKVDPRTRLPLNAILVTVVVNLVLALISIGSHAAFEAFISVVVVAYFSSFLLASGVMLHRRLTVKSSEMPWGPFKLGKAGVPITLLAMAYTLTALFFSLWPATPHPSASGMNYSVALFGVAVLFSLLFWLFWGRKVYSGPIWEFQGDGEYVRAN